MTPERPTTKTPSRAIWAHPAASAIGPILLAIAVLFQMRLLLVGYIWPRANAFWSVRTYAAWERSAILSEGKDFFEYVTFLRASIPETGKVVLPPRTSVGNAGAYTYITFMQYFLLPRTVLNCGEPVECVRGLTGSASYILRIGDFPPPLVAEEHKDYVPFRDGLGLYVPE
jgi:hypothetical protein